MIDLKEIITFERRLVEERFSLEQILDFQEGNSIEIIRNKDLSYSCVVNGDTMPSAVTPLWALVSGINKYKETP